MFPEHVSHPPSARKAQSGALTGRCHVAPHHLPDPGGLGPFAYRHHRGAAWL